ncbi:hypothetical protein HG530_008658 [Fusarium avenaceum]|nr:hypothetical protein HG530_008658 [Fusarium avenaceum]
MRGEVDSLVEVESMIETSVVRLREGDDKLPGSLVESVHTNACLLQLLRGQECDQLKQEIWLRLKKFRHSFLHGIFELFRVLTWDTIPRLGCTEVLVVGRVSVVVLIVPAERGKDHANIYPRDCHARNIGLDMSEQTLGMERENIEIPGISGIWIAGVPFNRWKSRAVSSTMNVSSVLNFDRFLEVSNQSPEFRLHVFFGDRSMTVEFLIKGHLLLKVTLLEVVRLFLELSKRVESSLLETELTVSNETSCAVPFSIWLSFQWWVKASWMVGMVAGFANE